MQPVEGGEGGVDIGVGAGLQNFDLHALNRRDSHVFRLLSGASSLVALEPSSPRNGRGAKPDKIFLNVLR
jgi:hypothetical protein